MRFVGDNLDDAQVLDRAGVGAHVTGHGLVLPDAAGGLAHADRTDAAMEHRAVRGGTARDTKAFDDALEAFALAGAADIDELAFSEGGNRNDISDLERRSSREADFAKDARGDFEAGLLRVTEFTGGGVLGFLGGETNLDGIVAVGFEGLDLDD